MIIMSATVDADRFSQYWGCPVLYVPGRQFPVNVRHIRYLKLQGCNNKNNHNNLPFQFEVV